MFSTRPSRAADVASPGVGVNAQTGAEVATRFAIRTRLFATFLALLMLTAILAVAGIAGMRHNQRALEEFEAGVMPEIARVLELAEKVAQLAAVVPSVADADSQSPNRDDRALVHALLAEIRRVSGDLPTQADTQLEASAMLDGIDRDLTRLLALSGERRELELELRKQRSALDAMGDRFYRERRQIGLHGAVLQAIFGTLVVAEMADEYTLLGRTEADAEALWIDAAQRGEDQRMPQLAHRLRALSEGDTGVFQLRRHLLRTERALSTVVQLTQSNSAQLGTRASAYVSKLRQVSAQRRDAVRDTVASGTSAVVLVSVVSVLTALAGSLYGRRVLCELQSMTRVMTRLAAGDVAQPTPAIERRDEIGELARAFQVFRDHLLEKQRLTAGLYAQGQLLESVFHSMNDGLSVYDAEGRLVAWNQKFASLLPFDEGFLSNERSVAELNAALPAGARWRAIAPETAVRTAQRRIATSAELHLPDGSIVEFLSHPMPDGGWVALCRDLTARRAIEAQLRQSQRMEVLGQLTGGIAHDFNNFLTAILGNLELLQERLPADAFAQGLAVRANKAAEAAAALSRRLLVFARRAPLEVESVSVDDMPAEMRDLIEYSVGPAIAVCIKSSPTTPTVWADRGQLENAILNLALNSAAAMPGGGTLSVEVGTATRSARVTPVGEAVVLRVSDTGCGMPPHVQARVLEPFFTTKPPGQGTGLGLSIVDAFVRQCGGCLVLESAEACGASVELWLPASRAPALAGLPRCVPCPTPARTRVLVVEDDASVRDTAVALFESLGATVRAADSEAEALGCLASEGRFDLVLSDVMLGQGGDGVALWRLIAERWPGQRVVLTSGMPSEVHAQRRDWPQSPAAVPAFLQKPFSRKSLTALLDAGTAV